MTNPTITVDIARAWYETDDIRCFELVPRTHDDLPGFEPGAHIDVHLPSGILRQYSLWNGPEDRGCYLIGVKREPASRGGSAAMHDLKQGGSLVVGTPRNNFMLREGAGPIVLLAGGIGITPVLAMGQRLAAEGRDFLLHFFLRDGSVPFAERLAGLPEVTVHSGLVPPLLNEALAGILGRPAPNAQLYMCGPGPFMDVVKQVATQRGWLDEQLFLERFAADACSLDLGGASFEVVLQRSGMTLTVGPDQTIIEVLETAGIVPLTSCEQGICGTCATKVIAGEPDHRDQYLTEEERRVGDMMMICVSRCKGTRLALDL